MRQALSRWHNPCGQRVMRRMKLLGACMLLILASLPLLPGRGWLAIAGAMAILEEEFVWMRRLMNALTGRGAYGPGDGRRHQHDMPTAPSASRTATSADGSGRDAEAPGVAGALTPLPRPVSCQ